MPSYIDVNLMMFNKATSFGRRPPRIPARIARRFTPGRGSPDLYVVTGKKGGHAMACSEHHRRVEMGRDG